MKPPKNLKVGYRTFQIKTAPLRDRYGECDKEAGKILYTPGQKKDLRLNTLIHEVGHACWEVGGLEDSDVEEKVITILANQLTDVLLNNPDFLLWINHMAGLNIPADTPEEDEDEASVRD